MTHRVFSKIMLTIFIAIALISSAFGQTNEESAIFDRGIAAYKQGNYQEAQNHFLSLWQDFPRGVKITGARLMLAKSYYKLADYTRVERLCLSFFQKYQDSAYLDDMHYLYGNTLFRQREFSGAVDQWYWVIDNSNDPRLKTVAGDFALNTMDHFLSENQIEALEQRYQDSELNGLAQIARAKKMIHNGERRRADSILRSLLRDHPDHFFADQAKSLLGGEPSAVASSSGFVFLKPTTGPERTVAEEMEQGIRYAIHEHKLRNSGERVDFQTVEVSPNISSALVQAQKEINRLNPMCIIGPINPDHAAAVSLISRYEERSHIIPLSSQSGLTDLNRYAFQINPSVHTKGRFLGEYVVRNGNARRVAVLAPVNDYGQGFVEGFSDAILANDGEVITVQWYYENTEDFTRQFREMWRKGIYYAFEDSVLAEEPELADHPDLQIKYQEYLDTTFEPRRPGARVDSTDIAATGVDAVLIVIEDRRYIQYMAAQVAFNNIQTQLLGNEGWNDAAELKKYKDKLEGLTYITPAYFNPNSENYRLFMNRFRSEMRATPETFHLLGYDIMKWVLGNYQLGMTAESLRNRLENTRPYQGIIADIEFGGSPRVNSNLAVLRLNYGQILKLE